MCGWIDDFEQLVHPDLTYGANAGVTLRQAQAAASSSASGPPAHGVRDPMWRPLHPGEVPPADPSGLSSPVCYIATPDPEGYRPYWLRRG